MRAAVVERYGPPEVVRIVELPTPRPAKGEVLVRVHAAAVTSADARIRGARFPAGFALGARLVFGVRRPRRPVLGGAFSGVIEELGPGVTGLEPGDAVCGMTGIRLGAHAELVRVARSRVVRLPAGVSHDDAAGVLFGGSTARFFLVDKATIVSGTTVLINGASGAIGTNAVQLAKHAGAEVTAVTSAANAALVRGLGADHVIDYRQHPVDSLDERFDVVLDTVGNVTIAGGRRLLRPGGAVLLAVTTLGQTLRARGDVRTGTSPERAADFEHLLALVADGTLTVVHDASFDLDDIVEAHRRVDSGRKVGNVIVHPDARASGDAA
jgi:NADPH:quinone reductase-like Zn-dependent oxidoreductase